MPSLFETHTRSLSEPNTSSAISANLLQSQEGDGFGVPNQESKRRLTFRSAVRDVMKGLSLNEIVSKMEPFLRRVVREEVERVLPFLHSSPRSSFNLIDSSVARGWQLHFVNKLPSTLFTGSRIEAEDSVPVQVVIQDACSKNVIKAGPLSSIKIEILVLDGDFGVDELEDWTGKEFNAHVVREREGKRPLVTGDRLITLRNGVGYIGDLTFTDNSSWIRSRRFRLGARAVLSTSSEVRIREARSEAFVVKDHRGELYKKHHPPFPGDEVWRLERIAKGGTFHKRLASKKIYTVKDFLRLYVTNPSSLRNILECGTANRTWETIIEHAADCVLEDEKYLYYIASQRVGLLFNSIYNVVKVTFDGQNYEPLDGLDMYQRRLVENLKRLAYSNINDLVRTDEPSVVVPSMPLLSPQADPSGRPSLALPHVDFPITHQGQTETQLGFDIVTTSPSYNYEVENNSQLEVPASQQVQVFTPALTNSFVLRSLCSEPYNEESSWAPAGSLGSALPTGHLAAHEISQVQTSTWFPFSATWEQGNPFLYAAGNEAEFDVLSPLSNGKPKAGWCKIRAAVKWGILARQDVAAKRIKRHQYLYC